MTSIALACPHTPWVEERVSSFDRLKAQLAKSGQPDHYLELTDKAPNEVWSVQMWKWMLDTGADFCLSLQDDVLAAPCFWPALRAMITRLPPRAALGLSGVHPMAREQARKGHRWYCTTSWLIGWAWGMWREDLELFYTWRMSQEGERTCQAILPNGEDALMNVWMNKTKRDCWHPVPSIVDHDVSIGSSYANDNHGHRRPWITWHGYREVDLVRPDFWAPNGKRPTHYHTVAQNLCWWCNKRQPIKASQVTGAMMCGLCLHETMGSILSAFEGMGRR